MSASTTPRSLSLVSLGEALNSLQNAIFVTSRRESFEDPEQKGQIADLIFSQKFGKRSFNLDAPERASCMETLYKREEFAPADASESVVNICARYCCW